MNQGVVADVAIHRDHSTLILFIMMLAIFNFDDAQGQKTKTEYILDSHGNKAKTPAGNVRNRKIWLVDWG